jgi:hypothetical protein
VSLLNLKLPWARLGAEGLVIVLGVLVALAVDRWVNDWDDRALEISYIEQLVENLVADSARLAQSVTQAETRRAFAVQLLSSRSEPHQHEPLPFLRRFEQIAWWAPLEYSREVWDELLTTGRLSLIRDPAIRRSLSQYYNRSEFLGLLEADWDEQLEQYELRARSVLPPLVRLQVVGSLPDDAGPIPVGPEYVDGVLHAFASDRALAVDLGQLAAIYGAQSSLYSGLVEDAQAVLMLLRGAS